MADDVLPADEVAAILAHYHPHGEPWPKHIHTLGRSHETLRRLALDLLRQADGKPAARALRAALDATTAAPAALFVPGEFTAHSGARLRWKIECDALTPDDWRGLALAVVDVLPPFGGVEGIPRGGTRFAQALSAHSTPGGPLLVADDVCTTGASLEEHREGRDAIGVVAFARGPVPDWVTPLFTLTDATTTEPDDHSQGGCNIQGPDGSCSVCDYKAGPDHRDSDEQIAEVQRQLAALDATTGPAPTPLGTVETARFVRSANPDSESVLYIDWLVGVPPGTEVQVFATGPAPTGADGG